MTKPLNVVKNVILKATRMNYFVFICTKLDVQNWTYAIRTSLKKGISMVSYRTFYQIIFFSIINTNCKIYNYDIERKNYIDNWNYQSKK